MRSIGLHTLFLMALTIPTVYAGAIVLSATPNYTCDRKGLIKC